MLTTLIPTLAASSIWWALAIHDYIETMRGYEIEDEPEPIEIKRSLPPTEHKKEMIQVKSERHCSVIDAKGEFVTFVLVQMHDQTNERGETESVQEIKSYSLKDGEQLVDASPPSMRQHAGSTGFISPIWDGSQWAETATADEIEAWEQEHPAPEVPPAPMSNAELEQENKLLKAQLNAATERSDFIEDCIAEMAMQVYAE